MDGIAASIIAGGPTPAVTIGAPGATDVPDLIALVNELAVERGQLFVMPIDPCTGVAVLQSHLAAIASSGDEAIFVARCGSALAGLATGRRGTHPARRGAVEIGIGVALPWRRHGIGCALMTALEGWARDVGCHRLQLPVVATNAAAIALYRKLGFVCEGTLRATALVAGQKIDELTMAKLIA